MATKEKDAEEKNVKEKAVEEQMKMMREMILELITENKGLKRELKVFKSKDLDESKEVSCDADKLIDLLLNAKNKKRGENIKLNEKEIISLCVSAQKLFLNEKSLLELEMAENEEIVICGPINGQFYDLLNILNKCGLPDNEDKKHIKYLFLGNYVNRGLQSLETISLLLSLKIKYPNNFYLLRGNHETSAVTRFYGFHKELKELNMLKLYDEFIECFDLMPIAAVIDKKIFTVCGGISPQLNDFQNIKGIERPCDVPKSGLLTDLLWSDHVEDDIDDYQDSVRGAGKHFGPKQVNEFCDKFKIELIIRGLQLQQNGHNTSKCGKVITVFSQPNYCGTMDNEGAVVKIDKKGGKDFITLPKP